VLDIDGDARSVRGSSAVARLTGSHLLCERGALVAVAVGLGWCSGDYAAPRGMLVAAPPTERFDPPGRAGVGVARDTLGLVGTIGGALQRNVEAIWGESPHERRGCRELLDRCTGAALVGERGHCAVEARRSAKSGLVRPASAAPDRYRWHSPLRPQFDKAVQALVQRAAACPKVRIEPKVGVLAIHRPDGRKHGEASPRQGIDAGRILSDVLDLARRGSATVRMIRTRLVLAAIAAAATTGLATGQPDS
jgi:hypothetical protein